jgi:Tol biopolymer transport system component
MAVRILCVVVVVAIFYGCGQSNSPPEQGEKEGAESKSVTPSGTTQQETTKQEPTQQVKTAPTDLEGKMVFAAGEGIWTMNANGSNLTPLTRTIDIEKDPSWSPDGRKIAFTSTVGDEGALPQLCVINSDGSDYTFLEHSPALHPTWSPDRKKIAFSSALRLPAYLNPAPGHIWVVGADGSGEPRRLTTEPDLYEYPAWSPDGKKIAFVRDGDIYAIDTSGEEDGANQQRLLTDHVRGRPVDLSWSPDGTEIAFASVTVHRLRYEEEDVYKMDADGSNVTQLTHGRSAEHFPT